VLALGAEPVPVIPHATTWDDRTGGDTLGGLMRDFELGYSRRLAVVIPTGPVWPLRGYELALLFTLDARAMDLEIQTWLVTPERSPLEWLGSEAVQSVSEALREAGESTSIGSSPCQTCAGNQSQAFRSRSTDSSRSTSIAASRDSSTSGRSETSPPTR